MPAAAAEAAGAPAAAAGPLARALALARAAQSKDGAAEARPAHYRRFGGLLFVAPYLFEFVAHAKARWRGLCLADMLAAEFPARNREYYSEAASDGRILVLEQSARHGRKRDREDRAASVPLDGGAYRIREGDAIYHYVHRHEPPSLDIPIRVISVRDDVVATVKPATVPVHAAGQYRRNTAVVRLAAENPGIGPLLPVHRLDKQVSGLLLFARNPATANALGQQIQRGNVRKEYVARVRGAPDALGAWSHGGDAPPPPSTETMRSVRPADVPSLADLPKLAGVQDERWLLVDAPLAHDPSALRTHALPRHDMGLSPETTGGARQRWSAQTLIRLWTREDGSPVSFEDGTFLVHVQPITGRTHQIRAHLEHAGFPIANDVVYGGAIPPCTCGNGLGGGVRCPQCLFDRAALTSTHAELRDAPHGECFGNAWQELHEPGAAVPIEAPAQTPTTPTGPTADVTALRDDAAYDDADSKEVRAWIQCPHCPHSRPEGFVADDLEAIYLHAYRYSSASWTFSAPLPRWANAM